MPSFPFCMRGKLFNKKFLKINTEQRPKSYQMHQYTSGQGQDRKQLKRGSKYPKEVSMFQIISIISCRNPRMGALFIFYELILLSDQNIGNLMGNGSVQDKHLKCGIRTSISYTKSGEEVAGTVYVHCDSPVEVGSLFLQLKGEQSCHWVQTYSTGKSTVTIPYDGQSRFFFSQGKLGEFGSNLNTGMYQFGFNIVLPPGLPQTSHFQTSQCQASAGISYSVVAVFKHPLNPRVLDYPFPLPLKLKSRILEPSRLSRTIIDTKSVCCCCERLKIKGMLELDKAFYCMGQTVFLKLKLQYLQRPVQRILVSLDKIVTMTSPTKTRAFEQNMQYFKLPSYSLYDLQKEVVIRVELGAHDGKVAIPTYVGQVVKINYSLRIILDIEGCCSGKLQTEIPIQIYNQKYEDEVKQHQFQLPQPWQPKQYPAVSLSCDPYKYEVPEGYTEYNLKI